MGSDMGSFLKKHPIFLRENVVKELSANQLGMYISEGKFPTIAFADAKNLQHHSLAEQIKIINSEIFNSTELFFSKVDGEGTQLEYDGSAIHQILFTSDSWGNWGGNIYSIPQLLQDLLALHKYNIHVVSSSKSSTGIQDSLRRIRALSDQGVNSDLVIQTIEPGTDFVADIRVESSETQTPPDNESRPDFAQLAVRHRFAMIKRVLEGFLPQKRVDRQPVPLEFSDPNNTDILEEYFKQILILKKTVKKVFFLGLPHNNISSDYFEAYDAFWSELQRRFQGSNSITLHRSFPRTAYDPLWHPTEEGALHIASKLFEEITRAECSATKLEEVRNLISSRKKLLFKELYPNL